MEVEKAKLQLIETKQNEIQNHTLQLKMVKYDDMVDLTERLKTQ